MKTTGYNHKVAPAKARWRELQWAKIRKRVMSVGKRPGDCVVLYLAGEENLDWKEARKNGFSGHNMIAVEREAHACATLRTKGVNTIYGSLSAIITAWKGKPYIDIIVADYTCGVCLETNNLIQALLITGGISAHTVVSVNLLRGHDPLIKLVKSSPILSQISHDLHRGRAFVALLVDAISNTAKHGRPFNIEGFNMRHKGEYNRWRTYMEQEMEPAFSSYKSSQGNLVLDGVLLTYTLGHPEKAAVRKDVLGGERMRVAAAKAIRTRRLPDEAKRRILAKAS